MLQPWWRKNHPKSLEMDSTCTFSKVFTSSYRKEFILECRSHTIFNWFFHSFTQITCDAGACFLHNYPTNSSLQQAKVQWCPKDLSELDVWVWLGWIKHRFVKLFDCVFVGQTVNMFRALQLQQSERPKTQGKGLCDKTWWAKSVQPTTISQSFYTPHLHVSWYILPPHALTSGLRPECQGTAVATSGLPSRKEMLVRTSCVPWVAAVLLHVLCTVSQAACSMSL